MIYIYLSNSQTRCYIYLNKSYIRYYEYTCWNTSQDTEVHLRTEWWLVFLNRIQYDLHVKSFHSSPNIFKHLYYVTFTVLLKYLNIYVMWLTFKVSPICLISSSNILKHLYYVTFTFIFSNFYSSPKHFRFINNNLKHNWSIFC